MIAIGSAWTIIAFSRNLKQVNSKCLRVYTFMATYWLGIKNSIFYLRAITATMMANKVPPVLPCSFVAFWKMIENFSKWTKLFMLEVTKCRTKKRQNRTTLKVVRKNKFSWILKIFVNWQKTTNFTFDHYKTLIEWLRKIFFINFIKSQDISQRSIK